MRRNLVEALGYGDIVLEKAKTMLPAAIKNDLMADPEFRRKMEGIGRVKLYTTDITVFLSRTAIDASTALAEGDGRSAAIAAAAARDYSLGLISFANDFKEISQRFLGILDDELSKFEGDETGEAKMPIGLFEQVRKSAATAITMGSQVSTDSRLQGLIRAGTVNVNHGMTTEAFHNALFGIAEILGIPIQDISDAYIKYLHDEKKRKGGAPIDVEVAEPKEFVKKKYTKALERSMGWPVLPDEPVPGALATDSNQSQPSDQNQPEANDAAV